MLILYFCENGCEVECPESSDLERNRGTSVFFLSHPSATKGLRTPPVFRCKRLGCLQCDYRSSKTIRFSSIIFHVKLGLGYLYDWQVKASRVRLHGGKDCLYCTICAEWMVLDPEPLLTQAGCVSQCLYMRCHCPLLVTGLYYSYRLEVHIKDGLFRNRFVGFCSPFIQHLFRIGWIFLLWPAHRAQLISGGIHTTSLWLLLFLSQ